MHAKKRTRLPNGKKIAVGVISTALMFASVSCTHPMRFGDRPPNRFSSAFLKEEPQVDSKKRTPPRTAKEHRTNQWSLMNYYAYYKQRGFKAEKDSCCNPAHNYHPAMSYENDVPYVSTRIVFRGSEKELDGLRKVVEAMDVISTNGCGSTEIGARFKLEDLKTIKEMKGVIRIGEDMYEPKGSRLI
ncbi:MAG: hypothetical protein ABIG39_00875 [Candidatus Micrarchaeota archaeon]